MKAKLILWIIKTLYLFIQNKLIQELHYPLHNPHHHQNHHAWFLMTSLLMQLNHTVICNISCFSINYFWFTIKPSFSLLLPWVLSSLLTCSAFVVSCTWLHRMRFSFCCLPSFKWWNSFLQFSFRRWIKLMK